MKALSHKKIEMKWYEPVTIAVGFGLFIWFCIPFFFGIFNVGSYFGIAVSILAMAYFCLLYTSQGITVFSSNANSYQVAVQLSRLLSE